MRYFLIAILVCLINCETTSIDPATQTDGYYEIQLSKIYVEKGKSVIERWRKTPADKVALGLDDCERAVGLNMSYCGEPVESKIDVNKYLIRCVFTGKTVNEWNKCGTKAKYLGCTCDEMTSKEIPGMDKCLFAMPAEYGKKCEEFPRLQGMFY